MNIDSIYSGIVLDHIKAGRGMDVYRYLKLDELDCPVAYIRNVRSGAIGRKDIIKIDAAIDLDLDVLGYIDPGITVNIIKDGVVIEKKKLSLPEKLVNVIHCKNPRCITTVESALDQHFILKDRERGVYRCMFCDAERKSKALR
ncbi:MAG: aspartate carbamoyltransferase regulatory subunit [Clostridia bacterium]|nr:aspartate carbamoyltransferase regulatory subunit [Clostridia bacterium]